MASNSQKPPTTKRNKRKALTLKNFYKETIQSMEETGEEDKEATLLKNAPPLKNEKWSQAFEELQCKFMRMEEIWNEKWETAQKENKSKRQNLANGN